MLLILSLWLAPWSALAAEPEAKACDPADPANCIAYLMKGAPAPFDGMLAGPRRAATLTVRANMCQERIDDAAADAREEGATKLAFEQQRRKVDNEANQQRLWVMRRGMEAYKEQFGPKWYDNPTLWFLLGGVAAVTVVAGAVAIIDNTRPSLVTAP